MEDKIVMFDILEGGCYDKMFDVNRRVVDTIGISPALNTCSGGGRQTKIVVEDKIVVYDTLEGGVWKNRFGQVKRILEPTGLSATLDTCGGGGTEVKVHDEYRIRKLTPQECWRLMGMTDEDFFKCVDAGISNSQLYKQAGNSIVVQVLEHLFTSLFKDR